MTIEFELLHDFFYFLAQQGTIILREKQTNTILGLALNTYALFCLRIDSKLASSKNDEFLSEFVEEFIQMRNIKN